MASASIRTLPLSDSLGLIVCSQANAGILDLNIDFVKLCFQKYGVLLFRGFQISGEAFREFTAQFLSNHQLHDSGDGKLDRVKTVYPGQHSIAYHAELSATPLRPDIIWFHCVKPAGRNGETTVCDGVRLFKELRPATREAFLRKRLRFCSPLGPDMSKTILRIAADPALRGELDKYGDDYRYESDPQGGVEALFITPAAQVARHPNAIAFTNSLLPFNRFKGVSFEDGSEIAEEVVCEVEATCEAATVLLQWERDDIAMIDNWRCMHGRRPFVGERVVRSVFGRANF